MKWTQRSQQRNRAESEREDEKLEETKGDAGGYHTSMCQGASKPRARAPSLTQDHSHMPSTPQNTRSHLTLSTRPTVPPCLLLHTTGALTCIGATRALTVVCAAPEDKQLVVCRREAEILSGRRRCAFDLAAEISCGTWDRQVKRKEEESNKV